MSSLRGSPRTNQQSGATKYNKRLKSISSYILERLPGFRRKTSVDNVNDVSPRSDISDSVSDLQGRVTKTAANSNPKNKFKAPHLLPSLSESHINNKSTKSGASSKATKKILVSSSSSGYDNAPSTVKSGTTNRSSSKQSQSNRTPASEYSASTVSASSSSSSAQKKHSPTSPAQDYSSSTVDSDTSGRYHHQYPSQQYNQYTNNLYRGGHSSVTTTTSPNVVIFGNNNKTHQSGEKVDTTGTGRSATASLLSQIGFPVGNGKSSLDSKVIPSSGNSQVISVKPAAQSANNTNNNATGSSATNGDYRHSRSRAHPSSSQNNPYEIATSTANTASASSAPASASKNGVSCNTAAVTAAAPAAAPAGANKAKLCCDKCDGKHLTEECPYYKKSREDHPDAQKNKQIGGVSSLPGNMLYTAKVVRQPGDGSCLFHSMSYGLPVKSNAARLRAEICQFIQNNPHLKISDTPLQDWVKWDANSTVGEYARKMSRGSWGGGIEMACFSLVSNFLCVHFICQM